MKATDIINTAREQLKTFISYEVESIYRLLNGNNPNFEEDEEYVLEVNGISVRVEVDNSYLDIEDVCYESRTISEIHATLDGNIFFVPYGDDDTEIEWKDLSTDELAGIANVLENHYNNLMKK